jgi:hypothetical protein
MYSNFLEQLENAFATDKSFNDPHALDDLLMNIFVNKNNSLMRAEKAMKNFLSAQNILVIPDTSTQKKKVIAKRFASDTIGKGATQNELDPEMAESRFSRFVNTFGDNFKPQLTTSMTSVRKYNYSELGRNELRMGTMAQRHEGEPRISPLFLAWIDVLRPDRSQSGISHLYINNLGRDRTNLEGSREKQLTLELEKLNDLSKPMAVITLPADHGLMNKTSYRQHKKDLLPAYYHRLFENVALGRDGSPAIRDFYIPPHIKEILYGRDEESIIKALLMKSFYKLGMGDNSNISPAQAQAVYFHFIKFELTNYIIQTLKPETFNFSCKDGIDRGGVSSAYYNLIKSIESGNPMNEDEFFRALHAAAITVKGRGLNDHSRILWNAIDSYIEGVKLNVNHVHDNTRLPVWLEKWRDVSAPQNTVQKSINELRDYIHSASGDLHAQEIKGLFSANATRKQDVLNGIYQATAIISLLRNPDQPSLTVDAAVLSKAPKLKAICMEIQKNQQLDFARYAPENTDKKGRELK